MRSDHLAKHVKTHKNNKKSEAEEKVIEKKVEVQQVNVNNNDISSYGVYNGYGGVYYQNVEQ